MPEKPEFNPEKEGIDPEIKERINKEGWEGTKEGGAAVLIGKKEEVEKERERLEQEEPVKDLETYIRLNKKIVVDVGDIENDDKKEKIKEMRSKFFSLDYNGLGEGGFYYIDKDDNIVRIDLDLKKINSYRDQVEKVKPYNAYEKVDKFRNDTREELSKLGFNEASQEETTLIESIIYEDRGRKIKKASERKEKEFDF